MWDYIEPVQLHLLPTIERKIWVMAKDVFKDGSKAEAVEIAMNQYYWCNVEAIRHEAESRMLDYLLFGKVEL